MPVGQAGIPFQKGGRSPAGALCRFIDEYGHGSLHRLPLHRNPGLEIVYLAKGSLVWQCEGKRDTLPPDSIYFTLPWEVHGSDAEYEPGHEWYFVVIKANGIKGRKLSFTPPLTLPPRQSAVIEKTLMTRKQRVWPATGIIRALMPELCAELDHPGKLSEARVTGMCNLLVSELAAIVSGHTESSSNGSIRINRLITELHRNIDDKWTLGRMADIVGLKRTQFTELLHKQTGDTPSHLLNRIRTDKARHLLTHTGKTVTEIAFDCGFSTSQYFSKVFAQFTGLTATAFRKNRPVRPWLFRGHRDYRIVNPTKGSPISQAIT